MAAGLIDAARVDRLKQEPYGRDRSFELVGDGIDKAVVLFVPSDFANQKDRVEDEACDNNEKEDDAQHEQRDLAPIEEDPSHV